MGSRRLIGRLAQNLARLGAGGRLLRPVAVLVAVTVLTFLLVELLPGDPAVAILGDHATPEALAKIRADLHLDRPLVVRYVVWIGSLLSGDFGVSYLTGEPVLETILQRLPVSFELMLTAQLLALALALPLGVISAVRSGTPVDRLVSTAGFAFLSTPSFLLAVLLIYLFAVNLKILPATGFVPLDEGLVANLRSLALPTLTLALVEFPVLLRVLRSDMIATLQQDFILAARAKGQSRRRILWVHALRPSSFTLLTIVGLNVGHLIGGAVVIETIFALPGIGRLLINAVFQRDYLLQQGVVLVIALGYLATNMLVDVAYVILDPRLRRQRTEG